MPKIFLISVFFLSQVTYANDIFYTYSSSSFEEIQHKEVEWHHYEGTIYKGGENGNYWFKITLDSSHNTQVIHLPESHLTRGILYRGNQEIKPLGDALYLTFRVPALQKSETFYLQLNCLFDATIPLKILGEDEYHQLERSEFMKMGIYYGVVLSILFVNLIYFINLRSNTYLHYLFMVIGMSMNSFYKDGLFVPLFGREGLNEQIEPWVNSIVVISSIYFATSFLRIDKYIPNWRKFGIAAVILSLLSNITWGVTEFFGLFSFTNALNLFALDVFWISGIILWKKSFESKLFVIAYAVPLLFAHGYYISPNFGSDFLLLPLIFYKLGSGFEMIFFTYAIIYQGKRITEENKAIRRKLFDYTLQIKELNDQLNNQKLSLEDLTEVYHLTLKEIAILKDIAMGRTNKEIADNHFISINTVKYHIRNILNKFEVNSKEEAGEKFLNSSSLTL